MKVFFSFLLIILALISGVSASGVFLYFRDRNRANLAFKIPDCIEYGDGYHHRFRPNCESHIVLHGRNIGYSINAVGMRERDLTLLSQKERVLVLGDSFVEGWGLFTSEMLTSKLEAMEPSKYFLNGAIRSSGPVYTAQRLSMLLPLVKPKRVIFIANENDLQDDLLFSGLEENGGIQLPFAFTRRDYQSAQPYHDFFLRLGSFGASNFFRWLEYSLYKISFRKIIEDSRSRKPDPCNGLRLMEKLLRENGMPSLQVVLVPSGPETSLDAGIHKREFKVMEHCFQGALDIRDFLRAKPEYFFEHDDHPNPEGIEKVAKLINAWLKANK